MNLDGFPDFENNREDFNKIIVAGTVAMISSSLVSPVGGVISAVASSYTYDLIKECQSKIFTDQGELDKSLAWAMGEAFRECIQQIENEWRNSGYRELKKESPERAAISLELIKLLKQDIPAIFLNTTRNDIEEFNQAHMIDPVEGMPLLQKMIANTLAQYIYGHEIDLIHILSQKVFEYFPDRFRYILNTPKENNMRAKSAYDEIAKVVTLKSLSIIINKFRDLQDSISKLPEKLSSEFQEAIINITNLNLLRNVTDISVHLDHLITNIDSAKLSKEEIQVLKSIVQKLDPYIVTVTSNPFLPSKSYENIFGRDSELKQLRRTVKSKFPPIISIYGLGGIGKTALARETVDNLMHDDSKNAFRAVVWTSALNQPNIDLTILIAEIERQLQITLPDNLEARADGIRKLLHKNKILIVIDNFETVEDAENLLAQTLGLIGDSTSKVLLTSRNRIESTLVRNFPETGLNGLDISDCMEYFSDMMARKLIDEHDLNQIFDTTNGMPLAVELIAAQVRNGIPVDIVLSNLKTISPQNIISFYDSIFSRSWENLSTKAKEILASGTLLNYKNGISIKDLIQIIELSEAEIWEILTELKSAALISNTGNDQIYIHPLTWRYVKRKIEDDHTLAIRRERTRKSLIDIKIRELDYVPISESGSASQSDDIFMTLQQLVYEATPTQFVQSLIKTQPLWQDFAHYYPNKLNYLFTKTLSMLDSGEVSEVSPQSILDILIAKSKLLTDMSELSEATEAIEKSIKFANFFDDDLARTTLYSISIQHAVQTQDFSQLALAYRKFERSFTKVLRGRTIMDRPRQTQSVLSEVFSNTTTVILRLKLEEDIYNPLVSKIVQKMIELQRNAMRHYPQLLILDPKDITFNNDEQ